MLAHDGDGGERLQRGHVAAAGHDHVGRNALVVAGPLPDADALGAVLDGGVHRQPLRRRVFARDHDVDVMAAAQAVVHHRQQAVGIRRKVNTHDLGLLVHDVVDETGILVREAVVILAPDMRGQQVVKRGDLPPPRQVRRDLQPLGVLVEHRIDDVDERLVAVEEPMPPGEQVALEPALALVLAEHFHHASGWAREIRRSARSRHPIGGWSLQRAASRPLESVSSGPKTRKFRCSSFSFATSRRKRPSTCVSPMPGTPGAGTSSA